MSRRSKGPLRKAWQLIKSVYYANPLPWRLLKSAALLFAGLFFWAGSNLMASYRPDWQWLYVTMAYGLLLIPFGPLTHMVLLPYGLPWLRRRPRGTVLHWLGKKLTQTNLTIFFLLVVIFAWWKPAFMVFDFQSVAVGRESSSIEPVLTCTRMPERDEGWIECDLEETGSFVGTVRVTSGESDLVIVHDPPYTFQIQEEKMETVVGRQEFRVELRDSTGTLVRAFRRSTSLVQ